MRDPVKRTLVVLVVLLPISTVLLIVFRDAVRETIVVPLLYLAWLTELTFNSIHEAVFWGLLVALAAVLLFFSVRPKQEPKPPLHWASDTDVWHGRRVTFWAKQIGHDGNDLFWGFQSASEFRKLILTVWAYRQHNSPPELEREIKGGAVELPPELRAYFEMDRRPYVVGQRYLDRAVGWLRSLVRRDNTASQTPSEAALEVAVRVLEAEFGADGRQVPDKW